MNPKQVPHMPRIEPYAEDDLKRVFVQARQLAGKRAEDGSRQVALVTPGRMIMPLLCPRANSMSHENVAAIQKIAPSEPPLRVVVIAFTELQSTGLKTETIAQAIPFLGYVLGLGYVGHNVFIFEGHPSVWHIGCKGAHLLVVDGGMTPHLGATWVNDAYGVMESSAQILVFGRDGKISPVPRPTVSEKSPQSSVSSDELFQRAMDFMKQGNWDAMIKLLTQAIQVDPQQFDSFYYRGYAFEKRGDFKQAIDDLTQAIHLSPKEESEIYASRADIYVKVNNLASALNDFNLAIRLAPHKADLYRRRSVIYQKQNATDKALTDLERAIQLEPNDHRPYTDRGLIQQDLGNHSRAIADFTKSIELNPENYFAYHFRSKSHAAQSDYKAAIADFEQYLRSGLPREMGSLEKDKARLQELKELANKKQGGLFRRRKDN